MARIISVMNQKGGTGKTTTVMNIAAYLANKGYKVLIADMEPQANATLFVGIDPEGLSISMYDVLIRENVHIKDIIIETYLKGLHLAPAQVSLAKADINLADKPDKQFKLKQKLDPVRGDYDYILIDCPPSLSLLPVNSLTASDEVLIPMQAQYLSLEGLKQLVDSLAATREKLNPELKTLGILFTMVDMRLKMAKHSIDYVRQHFGDKVFNTVIRMCSKLNEAPICGRSIFEYSPECHGAEDYAIVSEEIITRGKTLYPPIIGAAGIENRIKIFLDDLKKI